MPFLAKKHPFRAFDLHPRTNTERGEANDRCVCELRRCDDRSFAHFFFFQV